MPTLTKKNSGARKAERFLTPDEFKRLEGVLTSPPSAASPYSLAAIWILLLTGCRFSELLALSWKDVDMEQGCFHIDSKLGDRRTVPLSDKAKQILASLQRQEDNPYVFCGKLPGTRLTEISKVWQHVRILAGIPDVQLRDLRHSFAVFAMRQGADIYKISKVLGDRVKTGTTSLVPLGLEHLRDVTNKVAQVVG